MMSLMSDLVLMSKDVSKLTPGQQREMRELTPDTRDCGASNLLHTALSSSNPLNTERLSHYFLFCQDQHVWGKDGKFNPKVVRVSRLF